MNAFNVARECFNEPEQYSIVTTRAQVYISLCTRGTIDLEEYYNLIDDLRCLSEDRFKDENKFAVTTFFDRIKKIVL